MLESLADGESDLYESSEEEFFSDDSEGYQSEEV